MPAYASTPCVGLGRTPLSHVVGLSECTAVLSAARLPNPLTTFTRSRNGSSGFKIGENSNADPSADGVHLSMIAPCGTYANPIRGDPAAAVFFNKVWAG